jgi:hypothetical protein
MDERTYPMKRIGCGGRLVKAGAHKFAAERENGLARQRFQETAAIVQFMTCPCVAGRRQKSPLGPTATAGGESAGTDSSKSPMVRSPAPGRP